MKGEADKAAAAREPGATTVREVLDVFLKHISKSKKAGTVEIRPRSFEPFVDHRPV